MGSSLDAFSLASDGGQAMAMEGRHRAAYRAHLVLNLIFNDRLVLSDSQVVTARNFRILSNRDGVIREGIRQTLFAVAARDTIEGAAGLAALESQFIKERKILWAKAPGEGDELNLIGTHAPRLTWQMQDIARQYTEWVLDLIARYVAENPGPEAEALQAVIVDEVGRVGHLNRAFVLYDVVERLRRGDLPGGKPAMEALRAISETPYLGALPRLLSLTPTYTGSQAQRMRRVRSQNLTYRPAGTPSYSPSVLGRDLFIAGLNELDIGDIIALRENRATVEFKKLVSQPDADLDHVGQLAHAVCVAVEERILAHYPSMRINSLAEHKRKSVKKIGYIQKGAEFLVSDVAMLAVTMPGVGNVLGRIASFVIDRVTDRVRVKGGVDDATIAQVDHGGHNHAMRKLEEQLRAEGNHQAVGLEMVNTSSFDREMIT